MKRKRETSLVRTEIRGGLGGQYSRPRSRSFPQQSPPASKLVQEDRYLVDNCAGCVPDFDLPAVFVAPVLMSCSNVEYLSFMFLYYWCSTLRVLSDGCFGYILDGRSVSGSFLRVLDLVDEGCRLLGHDV